MASKMTQIYLGIGAVAILGAVVYMKRKDDAKSTNQSFTSTAASSVPNIKVVPEEADRLVVKAKDKPEVILEKKAGNWEMLAPNAGARIQKSAVDDLLTGLKGIQVKEAIAKGAANYASYELDEGKAIHLVVSKGGAVVADLWLGAQRGRGLMARIGADDQIWALGGVSAATFDRGPKDFRDKKVWDLSKDAVNYVELKSAKGLFSFTRGMAPAPAASDAGVTDGGATGATDAVSAAESGGDAAGAMTWLGLHDGKPIPGFEANKVDDLITAYSLGGVLNADDFGDGKGDPETGLGSAEATTIVFRTKEGVSFKITLGKTEGTKRYARKDGDKTTFLLSEGPSGYADVGADKFSTPPPPPPAASDAGAGEAGAGAADAPAAPGDAKAAPPGDAKK